MARCWAGGRCNHPKVRDLKGITVLPREFNLPCPPNPRLCPWRSLIGITASDFTGEEIQDIFKHIIDSVMEDDNVRRALEGARLLKDRGVIEREGDWALGYLMGIAWGSLIFTLRYESLRSITPEEEDICRSIMRERVAEIKRRIEGHLREGDI